MYRICIEDREMRLWLLDWIVLEDVDHPQFTAMVDIAMTFHSFDAALRYSRRLRTLGYRPHIQ